LDIVLESQTSTREAAMIRSRSLALVLLLVGVMLMLGSAVADIVGLGATPLVFGYRQMAGTVVGAVLAAVGAAVFWRTGRDR
jgi:hypothetical protein